MSSLETLFLSHFGPVWICSSPVNPKDKKALVKKKFASLCLWKSTSLPYGAFRLSSLFLPHLLTNPPSPSPLHGCSYKEFVETSTSAPCRVFTTGNWAQLSATKRWPPDKASFSDLPPSPDFLCTPFHSVSCATHSDEFTRESLSLSVDPSY